MEPQIRFCTSADGTRIAFTFVEDGREPTMLWVNYVFLPLGTARIMEFTSLKLEAGRQIVRFDRRGVGYSQRDVTDFSLDAQVADLVAVAKGAGVPQFDLVGFGDGCHVAAAFAARHPELVRRLALSTPTTAGGDAAGRSIASMVRSNWGLARGTIADLAVDGTNTEVRRAYIRYLGEVISPETAASYLEANWDPGSELGSIASPTLVIYPKRRLAGPIERSQILAAAIPGARLFATDVTDSDPAYFAALGEFFGYQDAARNDAERLPSSTAIILFADIADSTALTERLGDAAFREQARELDDALRRAITSNGGTAIEGKLLGDGVLATFGAAREAIACAVEMHRLASPQSSPPRVGEGLGEGSVAVPLALHVGIHAGDVIRESNNVYGGAVNIASRVAGEAAAGETLVSGTVRDLARTSAGVSFEDRGERELKGVGEPVRVYEVRWRETESTGA